MGVCDWISKFGVAGNGRGGCLRLDFENQEQRRRKRRSPLVKSPLERKDESGLVRVFATRFAAPIFTLVAGFRLRFLERRGEFWRGGCPCLRLEEWKGSKLILG